MLKQISDDHPWLMIIWLALLGFAVYYLGDVLEILAQR